MDFKIIWSDAAITDLKEICDYIAVRNPEAAHVRHGARDEPEFRE